MSMKMSETKTKIIQPFIPALLFRRKFLMAFAHRIEA